MGRRKKQRSRFVVYKIYWPDKGYYYGKTGHFVQRRGRHLRELKQGIHHNRNLQRKYALYGIPKIKIVAYADSEEHLDVLEKLFLDTFKHKRRYCNVKTC